MILEHPAEKIAKEILEEKFRLEECGFSPRVVLVGEEMHDLLQDGWLQSIKELPWGDTLAYELERRGDKAEIFLADGSLYGLWVVRVNTIERFKVF